MFYNDNKASFQQFVEMMRNERDRQYREDVQMMVDLGQMTNSVVQNKQQSINDKKLESVTQDVEETTRDDSLQQKSLESEYGDDSHGALRFVSLIICLIIYY